MVRVLLFFASRTKTDFDTRVVQSFKGPCFWFINSLGVYFAVLYLLNAHENIEYLPLLNTLFSTVVIIVITAGFYNLTSTSSDLFLRIGNKYGFDRILLAFISKVLRIVFIAISATIIAQRWGFDVNGFIAGLGIGGLAFALAAQDAIANVLGGMVIIAEKPFNIGDWILTPEVEGTVEDITFRSTKVRTFAQALVTVPNKAMANQPITNWSQMGRRRITFNLGVTYSTPREKLQTVVTKIKQMLVGHKDIHPETIFVNFDAFKDSSLDIFIYCFSKTTNWGEFLKVKEDVNFRIMEILEQEGVSVAFPSRTVYLEPDRGRPDRGTGPVSGEAE
ncbi:MAG: mechanosensitive ion channel family protein [Firmicutes bacterium]|nr:mechanosensitive ion channel family protein [Bacillota bacterium]